ncbi:SirB1 family protein [Sphingomonas bacterium]|uniref:SirB1 family protein n=1 Tax=Sphingomonas bacterium TaxID=1895847 RepID=UPI0015758681|nr:transglutaminase-like domain-containing protein [Sphingomonas bacterium]
MDDDLIRLGLIDEEDIILDEAALSLASLDHRDVDVASYRQLLEAIATRLRTVGGDRTRADRQADALAAVLHGEFDFIGDRATYDDPDNADLIRVVDRRRGLPVSLSILYVAAARRIGWHANVLDVPGHVLVLVGGEADPVVVDPFRGGSRVDRDELAALVAASGVGRPAAVSHVAAMPNRAILVRLLLNQAIRAETSGKGRRALELYRRMTALAPGHGHAWWERARLERVDGDVAAARSSLGALLEVTRDPDIRRRVRDVLGRLSVR